MDAFGDPKTFGKQVGGDIIENKKTYLYLRAVELGTAVQRKEILDLYSIHPQNPEEKVNSIKQIFVSSGAAEATKRAIEGYTQKAFETLNSLEISTDKKAMLENFGENLMRRKD